jgi:phosphatidate cytidylyltransferase
MPEITAATKSKSFTREITTLVGAPILIWVVGWAPRPIFIFMIFLITTLALVEFLVLGEKKGYPVQKVLSLILLYFLLSAFVLVSVSVEMGVFAVLLAIPAAYVFARSEISEALPACAVSVLGILYVGMLGGALLRLRLDFGVSGDRPFELPIGAKLVFFLLVVVWAGDAGAYYIGRRFGRRPLSPRVSPKKTVEGTMGGFVAAIAAAAIIHATFFGAFPLLHALCAAALLSATGVIGDLAESMWKRSAAVKDSGTLIPGHGGFLDRLDSILFTAPILYAYWFLLIHDFRIPLA